MPIQVSCPGCSRPLRAPDERLGQKVKCPGCAEMFVAATGEEFRADPAAPIRRQDSEGYRESAAPLPARREESGDDRAIRPRRRPILDDDDFDDDDYLPRRRRRHAPHRAGSVMTTGLLSLILSAVICPLICFVGIAAIIMSKNALRAMREPECTRASTDRPCRAFACASSRQA